MRLSVDEGSTYSSLDKVFVASTTIPLVLAFAFPVFDGLLSCFYFY